MIITIFGVRGVSDSMDRYRSELAESFPSEIQVRHCEPSFRGGIWGAVWHRRLKFLLSARRMQGDCNIIVNTMDAFLLLALNPARTLVVCHDVHSLIQKGWVGTFRVRFKLNLWLARRARAVVAVSEHSRKDLLARCPFIAAEKVVTIHNGLSRSWAPLEAGAVLAAKARLGLGGRRVVLHVGNDSWYKNFCSVLRAFNRVPGEDVVLVKAGVIDEANRRLINELSLHGRVIHIPHANDFDLRALYSMTDVLVFPSLHEGFGWPPVEAMACGCPVIASRRGSLPEICGDACLYVEPLDIGGMAAEIMRVMDDAELRARLRRQGKMRAAAFDWQTAASQILVLFQPVLSSARTELS